MREVLPEELDDVKSYGEIYEPYRDSENNQELKWVAREKFQNLADEEYFETMYFISVSRELCNNKL